LAQSHQPHFLKSFHEEGGTYRLAPHRPQPSVGRKGFVEDERNLRVPVYNTMLKDVITNSF